MKIFIPTTGLAERIFTYKVFDSDIKLTWVCHRAEDVPRVMEGKAMDDYLISNAKDYIEQLYFIHSQVKEGEWYIKADDNIRAFIGDDGNALSNARAWQEINEAINEAEKRGAKLVGFAPVDNPFFRKTKYRDVGYCIGKMYAEKRTAEIAPEGIVRVMDDYERTAQHLLRYGKVLVSNALHSKSKHYEKGGIGTYEDRLPAKLKDAGYLTTKYPDLFRFKAKRNCETKAELQVRFTSTTQVDQWRLQMRRLSK